ncbi:MAG: hypothetical protein WC240_06880 [Bacilli bacterium]
MNLTFEEKQQIETAIKNLTDILNKYGSNGPKTKRVTQVKFNKAFNELLKGSSQRYIDPKNNVSKNKTFHVEIFDKNGKWMLDYSANPKYPYFWYSNKCYITLIERFSLLPGEINNLMKSFVETQFKIKDAQISIGAD